MTFFLKKVQKLPLVQLQQRCISTATRLSQRLACRSKDKGATAIRFCHSFLKICEEVTEPSLIPQGLILLEFIKSLTIQVHQIHRIDIYPIKIRTSLLGIRWARIQHLPVAKLLSRAFLFLEQLKTAPLYDAVASDFYSHIERLYLEVIRQEIHVGAFGEAIRLAAACFEAFKGQLNSLAVAFDIEEKKMHKLVEIKLKLLEVLFRYEHGARLMMGTVDAAQVTAQIMPKYQRITAKIPINNFPSDILLMECQTMWASGPLKSNQSSLSKCTNSLSAAQDTTNEHFPVANERQRSSLQETVQYLNEVFRKRSSSVPNSQQAQLDRSPITLTSSKLPDFKRSHFLKEKNGGQINSSPSSEVLPIINQVKENKRQHSKPSKPIIEAKKFKLVLQMDRQAREKLILCNPFASAKQEDLAILGHRRQNMTGGLVVC